MDQSIKNLEQQHSFTSLISLVSHYKERIEALKIINPMTGHLFIPPIEKEQWQLCKSNISLIEKAIDLKVEYSI